ncbi:GNAT family N-acetyltransferase [Nocardia huaxiensis]|uniref:GNAT family N-acetyltransferase n=1 Tax=Nocardia huaxiensis TaxID=2755382 RepID=A0A7D6VCV4_9NOCA|nr:GNAT family N-acetyltransferase [Nocardia huaxiensis]QLY29315.1 GNAT family N-acetyltransferase [Nocardia huaxiensis]
MSNSPVTIDRAGPGDAAELAAVAAATFPLACPPGSTPEDMAAFIDAVLSEARFGEYLGDPTRTVLKAGVDGKIVGYSLLHAAEPADPAVAAVVHPRPVVELSKMYVLPEFHSNGVSKELMDASVAAVRADGSAGVWLGVNQQNVRAQRFYGKSGFRVVGTKTFKVGAQTHSDFVMQLEF